MELKADQILSKTLEQTSLYSEYKAMLEKSEAHDELIPKQQQNPSPAKTLSTLTALPIHERTRKKKEACQFLSCIKFISVSIVLNKMFSFQPKSTRHMKKEEKKKRPKEKKVT